MVGLTFSLFFWRESNNEWIIFQISLQLKLLWLKLTVEFVFEKLFLLPPLGNLLVALESGSNIIIIYKIQIFKFN